MLEWFIWQAERILEKESLGESFTRAYTNNICIVTIYESQKVWARFE